MVCEVGDDKDKEKKIEKKTWDLDVRIYGMAQQVRNLDSW